CRRHSSLKLVSRTHPRALQETDALLTQIIDVLGGEEERQRLRPPAQALQGAPLVDAVEEAARGAEAVDAGHAARGEEVGIRAAALERRLAAAEADGPRVRLVTRAQPLRRLTRLHGGPCDPTAELDADGPQALGDIGEAGERIAAEVG